MRLFIAINFNDETRARLLGLRDAIRSGSAGGNFGAPENMHLTIVFIGECDASQTAAVRAAMDEAPFVPFEIKIGRVGLFKRDGGGIWWAGVEANKILSDLQRRLTTDLISKKFAVDSRSYNPHITLGREVVTDMKPWEAEPFGETVRSIELMKSERIGGKLVYTPIYRRGCEKI